MTILLGLDVGTTAVKGALVDAATRRLVASSSEPTNAYADAGIGRFEQRVEAILGAVTRVIASLPQHGLAQVSSVGICGQMHGIVWWRAADVVQAAETVLSGGSVERPAWSRLVTWEDQRCSQEFLAKLESRVEEARLASGNSVGCSSRLATGYGLATYAHTLESSHEAVEGFDACGTIHDLLAFILCGHDTSEAATIDTTNACSWGAFDITQNQWNWNSVDVLGVPREILPTVKASGSIIGDTKTSVFGIPSGRIVFVPMGDHPCSVVAASIDQDMSETQLSLVNIGTSAQLAMILPRDMTFNFDDSRSFEVRPHVRDDQVLGVAAALSGGNIFAWFVRRCMEWILDLMGTTEIDESMVYEKLIRLGLQNTETEVEFLPTLNGERANPHQFGRIDVLRLNNGSLGDLSASLCRNLIQNLVGMVPQNLRGHLQASRIIGTGNALVRNPLLQHFLVRELGSQSELILQDAADAAIGAALIAHAAN